MQSNYTFSKAMLAKLNFIKILSNESGSHECELILIKHDLCEAVTHHTLYFYCRKENYLITLESTAETIETLIENHATTKECMHRTFINLIKLLKGKISKIIIYSDDKCYVSIEHELKQLEISLTLADALIIAKLDNCKIYITGKLLTDLGIKITKDLLEKALNAQN